MAFSDVEVKFLMGTHAVERATSGSRRDLGQLVDIREIGTPETYVKRCRIFQNLLEQRAARLGSAFTEFRAAIRGNQQTAPSAPAPAQVDTATLDAVKLF